MKAKVEFSTGVAFTAAGTGSYDTALRSYDASLPPPTENYEGRKLGVAEPRVAFADINADGLVDMLRVSGNQLWINTGETWTALPDSYDLPVVPTRHGPNAQQSDVGATFVDLNSDGVVDIAQCTLDTVPWCRSWINQFRPAAIKLFPRGQANNTIATYGIITQPGLVGSGYVDFTSTLESGTSYGSIPLKVVMNLAEDNGIGGTFVTTYQYRDLRGSAFGRGSQGFRQILITDPSGILTETTYSQRYPYSGLPTDIRRYSGGSLLSKTHTEYCDVLQPGAVNCSPGSPSHEGPFNFVYPRTVTDWTYLNPSSQGVLLTSSAGTITTTTSTEFDDSGNPIRTAVVAFSPQFEQHSKIIDAEYGIANSTERRMGKVTKSTVRTQSLIPLGAERVQTTQFEYRTFGANLSFALAKKKVEPGSSMTNPDDHLELHTAYDYDQFGNLTTTITCDPTLGDCVPTSTNPAFRKTSTSYSVAAFTPPPGTGLVTSLPYGPNGSGRFPVKTTNALNQSEYFVYDPRFGTVQQQTGPNGISTCNEYNTLGRQTKTIARCRSDAPQTATTTFTLHRRETSDPAGVASVTVTRPPTGSVSWGYADVLGRTVQTVTRAFSGGFTKTQTVYDEKGRVKQVSKPGFVNSFPTYWTTSEYDPIGRAWRVTEDLGFIDWGIDKKRITTSSFSGLGTTTDVSVTEGGTHSRYEEKNVLGKVSKVVDAYGTTMTFAYDADGNLTEAKEVASGHKVEMTYDRLGRKLSTRDPDLGWWHYTYTVYGELETQLDGRSQDTTMVYDKLGRMIRKIDYAGETAEWVYDVAVGAGVGKLAAMISVPDGRLTATCAILNTSLTTGKRTGKSFTYTEWGDVLEASECVNNEFFKTDYAYDAFGRQSLVRYPSVRGSRLGVQYHYTQAGFLHYLTEEADDSLYWKAVAVNAAGQVTREQTRNGVETSRTINDATGWLRNSNSVAHADSDRMIQSWAYNYDEVGNLKYRGRLDAVNAVNSVEDFQYDQLDRLTSSSVRGQGFDVTESYTYDSGNLGNLKTKNGKTYTYGTCNAGPHAVCSVDGGSAFTYDGNGSVLTGSGREFTYNAANRTSHITAGGTNVAFVYSADGNRVVQRISPVGGPLLAETIYVGLGGTGKGLYEKTTKGNTIEHVQFIYAGGSHGGNAFALRVVTEDVPANEAVTAMKYHSFDHLGSVTAVSDEFGHVVDATWSGAGAAGVMGYDAWGARRDPVGRSGTTSFELPVGHREFTGHETIPNIGVINMNGRMYDPSLGRFLSADPNVQFSADLQSYNRYSYVLNNPLRYTDPTGYFINGYFDFAVQVAITATSIAVCAGSSGVGCGFAFAVLATVYNTTSMVNSGAAWGDAIVLGGFSLAAGSYGGTIGGAIGGGIARGGSPFAGHLIGGVVGGLVSSGIMAGMTGQSLSAKDLLTGAAQSAFWSGVGWAVASQRQLSQASVEEVRGGDDIPARHANVGESGDAIQRGAIGEDEPIAKSHVKKELWRMWKRSGTGGAAHEEGVSLPRNADGTYGKTERWKPSITLRESRGLNVTDGNTDRLVSQPRSRLGPDGGVEAHSHPWKVGTRLFRQNGEWQVAGPGPSFADVGASIGYNALKVDVTSYVVAPEGIYRIGSRVEWIAPLKYIKP